MPTGSLLELCTVKMTVLNQEEIERELTQLSKGWFYNANTLVGKFSFKKYLGALDFVNAVGLLAEHQQHHPSIKLDYGQVEIHITTHDADNSLTDKDFKLAAAIDQIQLE